MSELLREQKSTGFTAPSARIRKSGIEPDLAAGFEICCFVGVTDSDR
ncbi:MAG: hypothetical protein KAX37_11210 [Opitutaceae bacterium]|nr:hypothetical protein [Opitutaceae bacterium]